MGVSMSNGFITFILFLIFTFTTSTCNGTKDSDCIYGIYVQTGSIRQAGTHSRIGLTLSDATGEGFTIPNLEDWGLMGPGFNYFETGELNLFGGKAPCLKGPVCGLNLTSDGSGPYHAWYCEYVQVSTFGVGQECGNGKFEVEAWLAMDREPYKLTAAVDVCSAKRLMSNM